VGPRGPLIDNDEVAAFVRACPDRLVGIASVDPSRPMFTIRELRRVSANSDFAAYVFCPGCGTYLPMTGGFTHSMQSVWSLMYRFAYRSATRGPLGPKLGSSRGGSASARVQASFAPKCRPGMNHMRSDNSHWPWKISPSARHGLKLAKIVAWLGERCINRIGRVSVRPRSRRGVKVPTGGIWRAIAKARERPPSNRRGQQIRCDSEADG
jgi:hypothetical protein